MKDWTWPTAVVLVVVIAALTVMFVTAADTALQNEILDLVYTVISFVVGALAGTAFGYVRGMRQAN